VCGMPQGSAQEWRRCCCRFSLRAGQAKAASGTCGCLAESTNSVLRRCGHGVWALHWWDGADGAWHGENATPKRRLLLVEQLPIVCQPNCCLASPCCCIPHRPIIETSPCPLHGLQHQFVANSAASYAAVGFVWAADMWDAAVPESALPAGKPHLAACLLSSGKPSVSPVLCRPRALSLSMQWLAGSNGVMIAIKWLIIGGLILIGELHAQILAGTARIPTGSCLGPASCCHAHRCRTAQLPPSLRVLHSPPLINTAHLRAGLCDILALFVVLCVHRPGLRLGTLR